MGISSAFYLQKMYTYEYKQVTWNSTQKIDLFVFQRFRLYYTFPFGCEGILFLAMRRCPSFIQSGIKMITKTSLVILKVCIRRVTSVQGLEICCLVHRIQKLKRFLTTKTTRLSALWEHCPAQSMSSRCWRCWWFHVQPSCQPRKGVVLWAYIHMSQNDLW